MPVIIIHFKLLKWLELNIMQQDVITLPEFTEVAHQLKQADALVSPAEAHGLLSGCVCAGSRISGKNLLEPILGHTIARATSGREVLMNLYHVSSKQLHDADFTFQLLLPINAPLSEKSKALTEWCQGFISGLGWAGLNIEQCQTEDVENALYHISEISKLELDSVIADNEDEKAFFEVSEYVRLAVMSIYMELTNDHAGNSGSSQSSYLH